VISKLQLRFGRAPDAPAEEVIPSPVTVFVGPNNSGKTRVLAELHSYCIHGRGASDNVILADLEFHNTVPEEVEELISSITLPPQPGEILAPDVIPVGNPDNRQHVQKDRLTLAIGQPNAHKVLFCQTYLQFHILKLDGGNRLALVRQSEAGDLLQAPQTTLQVLFADDAKRAGRENLNDALGLYFVIDPTHLGRLRIRFAVGPPRDDREERGIHAEAVEFHASATDISQMSDGVKAFTATIIELIAGDPKIILIDEPEAFLHPALSFKLGREISQATAGTGKTVFASTHSVHFVMGCIQSGRPVTIVRLTYRAGAATARVLRPEQLQILMRNPLLRSTGAIAGLFYEVVIITESDTDRAFYSEINERLVAFKNEWGVPNCLFLNAQNKQTIGSIMKPLRELGIPAAAIVDIDILKEGGRVWKTWLESAYIPEMEHEAMANLRQRIKDALDKTGKEMKRDGGIELLSGHEKEAARNLFEKLGDYGVFVVRGGEVETWLKDLGAAGHGPDWLIDIFLKIGEDPESEGYVKPSAGDVWEFLARCRRWLVDAERKGIPA
jgi:hypothetical protein